MKDLTDRPFANLPFTLSALRGAYEGGASPRDILTELYARLDEIGDPGIFIHLAPRDEVLTMTEMLGAYDPALPLWGIPFAVKDNIDVFGMPTTAACPAWTYEPDEDAFVVARLRQAGAIPVGKTNLDQFATGLVGVRSPYQPPLNACDPEIVPGGSSSGSAVAVGHGAVPFALGTDTAGSGRVPAALNGIVGLKPSLGMLSATGVVPACRTLDTISIFAATVADAHAVLRAATAYDAWDSYSRRIPASALPTPLPRLCLAVPNAASLITFGDTVQAAAFADTVAAFEANGAEIAEIDLSPFYEVAALLYEGAWVAERFAVVEDLYARDRDAIHPVTRGIVEQAQVLSATDAFREIYRLADLKRACEPVLAAHDMLCVPTIPTFYTVADLEADPIGPNSRLGTYTNFVNLLDLCALAFSTGSRSDGRPGSVTLIGPAGSDGALAAEAMRLRGESAGTASPTVDELTLAVCGAHMSGLPLNGALTSRGARFLGDAWTAPGYRLHALPGGPPERPGLVRARGDASIALELWAMPRGAFGDLLSEIPAPLGLGRIALESGTEALGFLCEAAGVDGAIDITHLGGWRAWLRHRTLTVPAS